MITTRLQLASRIQLLLFRELGEKIAIDRLLSSEVYARDVLAVCEGLRNEELVELARRLHEARTGGGEPGHEPHPADGSDDTSGFGYAAPKAAAPAGGWLAATRRWFGR